MIQYTTYIHETCDNIDIQLHQDQWSCLYKYKGSVCVIAFFIVSV
jgi:hypothetical protein